MDSERTFWRLLGDYERLTRDESAALRDRDFALLAEIQERKPLLFASLQELAASAGLDRRHLALNDRLESLRALEESNAALLASQLASSRAEHRAIEGLRHRVRGLGQAYGSAPATPGFVLRG
jgi:hypothetical protein